MQVRVRSIDERLVERLAGALRVKNATARCLVARGVTEPQAAQGFIDPRLAALRPPSGLAGMSVAVGRISDAVVNGERIGVFGDYDVDGITTAALLTSFLPTLMLSGFIFPISSMPHALQLITLIVPARYFLIALRGIVLKGTPLGLLWPQMTALSIYALVMLSLASLRLAKEKR